MAVAAAVASPLSTQAGTNNGKMRAQYLLTTFLLTATAAQQLVEMTDHHPDYVEAETLLQTQYSNGSNVDSDSSSASLTR